MKRLGILIGIEQTKHQLCKYRVICLGNVSCLLLLFYVIRNEPARPHEEKRRRKTILKFVVGSFSGKRDGADGFSLIYILYIYIFLLLIEYNRIYGFAQFTAVALQRYA